MTYLDVTMMRQETAIPCPHFKADAAGDTVQFSYPVINVMHTLTVMSVEEHTIDAGHLPQDMDYPSNCVVMVYAVSPGLPQHSILVQETAPSDAPRHKDTKVHARISGVTYLAAIFPGMRDTHTACSALHFEPVKEVEWHMVFHEKLKEDILISLI